MRGRRDSLRCRYWPAEPKLHQEEGKPKDTDLLAKPKLHEEEGKPKDTDLLAKPKLHEEGSTPKWSEGW